MNPCKECLNNFGKALCEGLKGCVFEDVPNPKADDFFQDSIHAHIARARESLYSPKNRL